jgi:hypothetical protein
MREPAVKVAQLLAELNRVAIFEVTELAQGDLLHL